MQEISKKSKPAKSATAKVVQANHTLISQNSQLSSWERFFDEKLAASGYKSLGDLANSTQINKMNLSRYRRGQCPMTLKTAAILARAFNVDINEFAEIALISD